MAALGISLMLAILATFEVFWHLSEPDRVFKDKVGIISQKGPIWQPFARKNGHKLENPTLKVPFWVNFKDLYSKLS